MVMDSHKHQSGHGAASPNDPNLAGDLLNGIEHEDDGKVAKANYL
jgi:hypothetical protein